MKGSVIGATNPVLSILPGIPPLCMRLVAKTVRLRNTCVAVRDRPFELAIIGPEMRVCRVASKRDPKSLRAAN